MKRVRLIVVCLSILLICAACGDLLDWLGGDGGGGGGVDLGNGKAGSIITPAETPALLLYNTSANINDTTGQAIGAIPAVNIPATAKAIRSVEGEYAQPLLKDLPWRRGDAAEMDAPRARLQNAPAAQSPQRSTLAGVTTHTFKAISADNYIISVKATKRGESEHCYVFVEDGQQGTFNYQTIADFYENQVWPKDTALFGEPLMVSDKIVILYYQMKDKKNKPVPYILGFFYYPDLQTGGSSSPGEFSNGMNIFYLNLSFGKPDHEEMKRTLFHEFQHMINYSRRVLINGFPRMNTWMDEGLAESAEQWGMGTYGASRVKVMNADPSGRLANGCSLTYWGNDADDIDYGLAYTFMQYLRLHSASGWNVMRDIIDNPSYGDHRALEAAMSGNADLNTFEKMLGGYHTARFLNAASGIYSFGGERNNFKFTPRSPTIAINASTRIIAGGALYLPVQDSAAVASYSPGGSAGANIRAYKHLP